MKARTVDEILFDVRTTYPDDARRLAALAQEVTMRDLEILLLRRRLLELAPLRRRSILDLERAAKAPIRS